MKTAQVILNRMEISAGDLQKIMSINPQLVFAFGSTKFFTDSKFLASLAHKLPNTHIVGCSTAGEISSLGIDDGTLVLTSVHFEKARVRVHCVPHQGLGHSMTAGEKLGAELNAADLKGLLVLAPGTNINGDSLIQGLQSKLAKGTTITGGLAGDGGQFQKTYSICNDKISSDIALAVGFYGQGFDIQFGTFGGWQPAGEPLKVTKAIGNLLLELDGKPALDVYKKFLGDAASEPGITLSHPFAILSSNKANPGTIRTPLGMNEANRSLVMGGDIPSGAMVSMMRADTSNLVQGAGTAAKTAMENAKAGTSLAIIISCVGRKLILGKDVIQEYNAVKAIIKCTNIAGFYSNGEIAPSGFVDDCRLHNQTMTITRFQEL